MSNYKPASVVFSMPGSSSDKFNKPLDELIRKEGGRPADIKSRPQNKRVDLKGIVQKNVKENTHGKPARALNATKSTHNPRLNSRAEKGRSRPVFIVPPKKDDSDNKTRFNKNNNIKHSRGDEQMKVVVKNDQYGKKELKSSRDEDTPRITIKVNRADSDEAMSDDEPRRDRTARPRVRTESRRRSRDRSDSDEDERPRRRPSVNTVQPSPMYVQPQYSVPMVPAPVAVPPQRMFAPLPPGQGMFSNILHSIIKQGIDERLNQVTGLPPVQPTVPARSYYGYQPQPVEEQPVQQIQPQPVFSDNERSSGLTLNQRFGSAPSKASSTGSKITVRLH